MRTQHGPTGLPVPSGRGRLRRSGPPRAKDRIGRPGTARPIKGLAAVVFPVGTPEERPPSAIKVIPHTLLNPAHR
jgi:hypothetical protein